MREHLLFAAAVMALSCGGRVAEDSTPPAVVDSGLDAASSTCRAFDVRSTGICEEIGGYYWNGWECAGIHCSCLGPDCHRLYPLLGTCEAATKTCR